MDYYKIGQRIRKFRKLREWSQEQLAEQIGISTVHMSHIETGSTKLSLPVLVEIAKVLHVSTDELLFDAGERQKEEALDDVETMLQSCTPNQSKIIAEVIQSLKSAMDTYN